MTAIGMLLDSLQKIDMWNQDNNSMRVKMNYSMINKHTDRMQNSSM